jgi:Catalase
VWEQLYIKGAPPRCQAPPSAQHTPSDLLAMGHPKFTDTPVYTASNGAPVFNPNASQRVGTSGPLLLQDFHLIDLLAHFDRERIPER